MTSQSMQDAQKAREEAAEWFAALRGPDSEVHRPAFEVWLNDNPLHLRAYNDISETFHLGRALKTQPPAKARQGRPTLALAAIAICLIAIPAIVLNHHSANQRPDQLATVPPLAFQRQLQTSVGAIRRVRLPDGSTLTLDATTMVTVNFRPEARLLTLVKGRARFDVAHEARPFQVIGGNFLVTAHGTLFDIALSADRAAQVHLIRGAIDVRPIASSMRQPLHVTQMRAGEKLIFDMATAPRPAKADRRDDLWPNGLIQYDAAPLRDLVADANLYTVKPVILGDPTLEDVRVSGTFHLHDTSLLVKHLAILLNLSVSESSTGILINKRCDENILPSCPSPP